MELRRSRRIVLLAAVLGVFGALTPALASAAAPDIDVSASVSPDPGIETVPLTYTVTVKNVRSEERRVGKECA